MQYQCAIGSRYLILPSAGLVQKLDWKLWHVGENKLQTIILSDINQTQKGQYHIFSVIVRKKKGEEKKNRSKGRYR